jgi:excisionase family DNA binding protein
MMRLHHAAQTARNQTLPMQIETLEPRIDRPARREFLTRSEVARRYGVSLSTVTRWARTGVIRTVRTPGGHYRYPADLIGTPTPTEQTALEAGVGTVV